MRYGVTVVGTKIEEKKKDILNFALILFKNDRNRRLTVISPSAWYFNKMSDHDGGLKKEVNEAKITPFPEQENWRELISVP